MIDPHSAHVEELARLRQRSNALRRSLSGLRTGTRNVLQLAAQLDDDLAELTHRIANTQPEEAQQHADATEIIRH